ncbi:hypothetical protein [Paracoccus sp. pheM1]|uniref:hypothetical protein n=1 Tax=Paracoccus sp. pheM1 TaxID=2831675 RepID=UPI001BDB77A2|nr:hypothetical protein [Paracoccus sp. pheM1]MBT0780534.1 hypothetical protein [Paracoccus sp. pheM1]
MQNDAPEWIDVAFAEGFGWSTYAAHDGDKTRFVRSDLCASGQQVRALVDALERIAGQKGEYSRPFPETEDGYGTYAVMLARETLAALTPAPQPEGQVPVGADALIDLIEELGREVYYMLDDCETSGPVGEEVHTITTEALEKVSAILDRIETLPFEVPGVILGPGAMLQEAIKQTFLTPAPDAARQAMLCAVAFEAGLKSATEVVANYHICEAILARENPYIAASFAPDAAQTEAAGREWWIVMDHGFYRACPRKPAHRNPVLAREVIAAHPAAPAPGIAEAMEWQPPRTDYEAVARMAVDGDADPIGTARRNYPHLFPSEMEKCHCVTRYGPDPQCKTCGGYGDVEVYVRAHPAAPAPGIAVEDAIAAIMALPLLPVALVEGFVSRKEVIAALRALANGESHD